MAKRCAVLNTKELRKEIEELLPKEDISYLIDISLSMGNNTYKILQLLDPKDADKFIDLQNRIVFNNCTYCSRPMLLRICNAFPETTCELLIQSPNKGPVSLASCVEASGYQEFPTIARHPACSTLIPEDFNYRAEALEVILLPNMLFSSLFPVPTEYTKTIPERVQNYNWRRMSARDKFRYNFQFLEESFHWPVIEEDDRWELARKYGILTENNDLSEVWVAAAEAAGKYLMDNYRCGLEASGRTMVDIVERN